MKAAVLTLHAAMPVRRHEKPKPKPTCRSVAVWVKEMPGSVRAIVLIQARGRSRVG